MTTEKINNQPAFPIKNFAQDMTLRDYFAAKAMQGLIAARDRPSGITIVEYSYKMADGMLKERARNANLQQ